MLWAGQGETSKQVLRLCTVDEDGSDLIESIDVLPWIDKSRRHLNTQVMFRAARGVEVRWILKWITLEGCDSLKAGILSMPG